jgi:hypothetical protein
MFTIRAPKNQTPHELDKTITELISEFAGEDDPEKEIELANTIKILMEARTADKAASKKPSVSPDTIASIAASLLGLGLIMTYEQKNVITTKAFGLVPKIRI